MPGCDDYTPTESWYRIKFKRGINNRIKAIKILRENFNMHQSCKDFAELKQVKEIVEGVINCPWMDKNTYLVIAQELERNDIREFRSETCPKINGRLEESRSLKW